MATDGRIVFVATTLAWGAAVMGEGVGGGFGSSTGTRHRDPDWIEKMSEVARK